MIGDDIEPFTYTDTQLTKMIVASARMVLIDAKFSTAYIIDAINQTITPDPLTVPDNNFISLVALKAACLFNNGQATRNAGQAIRIVDNRSEIDLRDAFRARQALVDGSWCKTYKEALSNYRKDSIVSIGGLIVTTPIRV